MKKRNVLFCLWLLLCLALPAGCGSQDGKAEAPELADLNQIYEKTISPNAGEGVPEEDLVYYTIRVYQGQDNTILVRAESNSAFFEPLQYELAYDKEITEADMDVQWTTLMGNPEPSEEDQLAIAWVSVLDGGEEYGKWKISFVNQGIEWMEEAIQQ